MTSRTILEDLIEIKKQINLGNNDLGLRLCWIAIGLRDQRCNKLERRVEELEEKVKRLKAQQESSDSIRSKV